MVTYQAFEISHPMPLDSSRRLLTLARSSLAAALRADPLNVATKCELTIATAFEQDLSDQCRKADVTLLGALHSTTDCSIAYGLSSALLLMWKRRELGVGQEHEFGLSPPMYANRGGAASLNILLRAAWLIRQWAEKEQAKGDKHDKVQLLESNQDQPIGSQTGEHAMTYNMSEC